MKKWLLVYSLTQVCLGGASVRLGVDHEQVQRACHKVSYQTITAVSVLCRYLPSGTGRYGTIPLPVPTYEGTVPLPTYLPYRIQLSYSIPVPVGTVFR